MITATITAHGFIGVLGRGAAPRELECLLAVAAGQTTKEIAKNLGVAPDSVSKRLLSLTTKLGVVKRTQLVARAFALGMISFASVSNPTPEHQRDESHDGVFIA
ncbi:response regulator transcription factor [Pseudomonas petrae]|uniref:Helix-turn-helix transcriptional regulator n=1 Tax=Pseudomonas petrae TaxID=2912190 RepID=A0ABS9HZW2_9PSED|nr:helix-turn-helix transcriptional regulator [Pseudomonas petrae]MCF7540617.1 helix-turn-helix transcriptional regulator [Pseudomonas petrae]